MGLISVSLPADGSSADVADYNTPITSIVNLVNGNLDNSNISGLDGSKLVTGSVPASALDATTTGGWVAGLNAPNTVTANGNRSYTLTFNSVNYSTTLSAGMRLRTTRTVAAPTQCTSLNGSTQYYSKSSPAGMTFTDDFVVSAWIPAMTSYPAGDAGIVGRGTSTGWWFGVNSTGQVILNGFKAGAGNFNRVVSYQSIPLNKKVHVVAQLDMSSATVTGGTANYIMIDGVDVPCSKATGGTAPTDISGQTGDLTIGALPGGTNFFSGKLAQVAIYSAKVTQATILASMNQKLAGTETSLISAYSFDNAITDLNTTNANNLTANGSAVATNADSPFGTQADGTISSTLDYAIIQKVAYSTNTTVTVQVPEGCTIPTSGGVSAIVYSSSKVPYGFPTPQRKWSMLALVKPAGTTTTSSTYSNVDTIQLPSVPIGEWNLKYRAEIFLNSGNSTGAIGYITLSTATTTEVDVALTGAIHGYLGDAKGQTITIESPTPLAAMTTYYLNIKSNNAAYSMSVDNTVYVVMQAENTYL